MTVYVDNMRANYGRMKMCHMIADTEAELHAMADKIGVARKWFQAPPDHDPHYDIALSKRALAVAAGAQEITLRECALMIGHWRRTGIMPSVSDVPAILAENVARVRARMAAQGIMAPVP